MDGKPIVVIDFKGPGGNTLAILAACKRAASMAGWPREEIEAFQKEFLLFDREHAMDILFEAFEVEVPVKRTVQVDRNGVI